MKISDLLRKLASQMDEKEKSVPLSMATKPNEEDPETQTDDTSTMIPPLQQHLELMKKQSGLDNAYSDDATDSDQPDDLDQLKRMAGLPQSAIRTVGDQNENK